jgi:hypothetical protein
MNLFLYVITDSGIILSARIINTTDIRGCRSPDSWGSTEQ